MNSQSIEIFEKYITEAKNLAPSERENFLTNCILKESDNDKEMTKFLWEEVTQLIHIYRRGVIDGMDEMKSAIEKIPSPVPPPPAPEKNLN